MSTPRRSPWKTDWEEVERWEVEWLRSRPIAQTLADYRALQSEFRHMVKETDALYGPERDLHSVEFESKLYRLGPAREKPMDALSDTLVRLQQRLERAGIPSAVIGGMAVGAWGNPRLTRDVDLKILLRREERQRLLELLTPGYTPMHADPDEALRHNGVIFLHDEKTGVRLDVHLADTDFDELLIGRARVVELEPGVPVRVCAAEDLVILKLIASRPVDIKDVESVIWRQASQLDDRYILHWLGLFEKMPDDSTLIREFQRLRTKHP
jgi:hypothetical protein